MKEQLNNAIASLINKSLEAFQAGADFLAAEIPDVVHQLLVWKMYESAIMFVLALSIIFFLVKLDIKLFQYTKEHGKRDDLVMGWGLLGSFVRIAAYGIPIFRMLNLTWLKIWLAPKLFLIEYAASLVK